MSITLPSTNLLNVYWIPSVGIGDPTQTVDVPLETVLDYDIPNPAAPWCRVPQINVVNLAFAHFPAGGQPFQAPYLTIPDAIQQVLTDGTVRRLQDQGIKVVLSITGANSNPLGIGWSSIPANQISAFVNWLKTDILQAYGLDGIDIDDEYALDGGNLLAVVKQMSAAFPAGTILSKALFSDMYIIADIAPYLTFGGIMTYGDDASYLEEIYQQYRNKGLLDVQLLIGVNAGPVAQSSAFTSVETTEALTRWQPDGQTKRGMMLWTFSQDILQFTEDPQNQPQYMYPNPGDHSWQEAIVSNTDWSFDRNRFVPKGSYLITVKDLRVILSAQAKDLTGNPVNASLDITGFAIQPNIANINGVLIAEAGTAPANGYVPGGSYTVSCSDVRVTLYCTAQEANGGWVETSLDITTLSTSQLLANLNGMLANE